MLLGAVFGKFSPTLNSRYFTAYACTIAQYAAKFERYRSLASDAAQARLDTIPAPPFSRFEPKQPRSEAYDQDRLRLGNTDALRYKRCFGLVALCKRESNSAGAVTPASFQVVTKVCWWQPLRSRWERGFVRTTAYSASYSPKYAAGHASHLALGMPVVGILERPPLRSLAHELVGLGSRVPSRLEGLLPVYTLPSR